jgi:hypothetical protein
MNKRDRLSPPPNARPAPNAHAPLRLAHWLITRAAHRAPAELADRLEEEWLADLGAQHGVLAQMGFALGCSWATQVITRDAMVLGARGVLGASGTLAGFAPAQLAPGSNRSTVVMVVLVLHGVALYALFAGLIHPPRAELPTPPIHTTVIYPPNEPPQAPPGPKVPHTPWTTVTPDHFFPVSLPPLTGATPESEQRPEPPTVSQEQPVHRVAGGPGAGFPSADRFYPPDSIRFGETGAPAVRVCVDERGLLAGDPVIADSSGSARLDAGALALARAGSGHYRSTTEDGKPVSSCYAFRVRFRLRS